MRTAIISDIHGNLVALQAALSDIETRRFDCIVCLGDVAATGPQPCEVIELLRSLECRCVMGNTDASLARDLPGEFEGQISEEDRKRVEELDAWTRKQLTKSHRQYLSTFDPMIRIQFEPALTLLCYHGTPSSNREGISPTMSDDTLVRLLEGHKADVFAGGHTHTQMYRRFQNSVVLNPGSVGLPFERDYSGRMRNPARAEYAVTYFSGGVLGIELLSVRYSLPELRRAVLSSDMPDPAWWLSDWV